MNKFLLTQMIELAKTNKPSKHLNMLALQITVDPELNDDVVIEDFSNEFYSVSSLRRIKQCFNFQLI